VTAFFQRTDAANPDPDGDYRDRWWMQGYNKRHRLVDYSPRSVVKWLLPARVKSVLKRFSRPRGS